MRSNYGRPDTQRQRVMKVDLSMESGDAKDADRVPSFEAAEMVRRGLMHEVVEGRRG